MAQYSARLDGVFVALADRIGLVPAMLAAAGATALGAASIRVLPLLPTGHLSREPASFWPEPMLTVDPGREEGPVVVEVTYVVTPENEPAFLAAMPRLRRTRLRTGAVQWGIFRTGERPGELVEVYVVPTWDEHLRQHSGRMTGADEEVDRQVRDLSAQTSVVHRLPAEG